MDLCHQSLCLPSHSSCGHVGKYVSSSTTLPFQLASLPLSFSFSLFRSSLTAKNHFLLPLPSSFTSQHTHPNTCMCVCGCVCVYLHMYVCVQVCVCVDLEGDGNLGLVAGVFLFAFLLLCEEDALVVGGHDLHEGTQGLGPVVQDLYMCVCVCVCVLLVS